MSYISVPSESASKLKDLSGKTIYVYLLFRSILTYKKGLGNKLVPTNDIIQFTYQMAKNHGIDSKLFSKIIKTLVNAGLIRIVKRGKRGSGRNPTLYQIF